MINVFDLLRAAHAPWQRQHNPVFDRHHIFLASVRNPRGPLDDPLDDRPPRSAPSRLLKKGFAMTGDDFKLFKALQAHTRQMELAIRQQATDRAALAQIAHRYTAEVAAFRTETAQLRADIARLKTRIRGIEGRLKKPRILTNRLPGGCPRPGRRKFTPGKTTPRPFIRLI